MHAFDRGFGSARRGALAAVVLMHAAAVLAWWQLPPATMQRVAPARIVAMIVGAQAPEQAPASPPRAMPKASTAKPRAVAPASTAAANEAAPALAPMQEAPAVSTTAGIAIESAPVVVAAAAPAPAPPAPAPLVPPRFDASYLDNAPPAYPSLARQYREQGVVMLDVRVTAAGLPDTVEIRKSSGSQRLDEAARAAVLSWRFVPARQGDSAVTAWVVVPIRFALNG